MPAVFASIDAWTPSFPTPPLEKIPMNLDKFPRYPLTFGPSPIQPLKRLSAHLGGKVELFVKREDCNSGLAFGGNKTRKLEYLIPEAIEGGYDTLVSIGGIQSNQTRQVAAVAAHLGMKCVLVQENWVNYSDAVYDRVGNIEMSRIMGADVRLDAAGFDIGIRPSWEKAMEDVRQAGGKPFPIPAGCSEHPLGGIGFVAFAEEVRAQEAELGFKFDYIVVCAVTGSTQAGMIVGFAADGRAERVIGIDASAKPEQTRAQVLRIAQNTAKLVELGREITDKDVVLDTRFGGPEYGLPNEGTLEAIRLCAQQEGMLTDPVYEGKSMHGMIEMVRRSEFPEGAKVLYAHLGGVPALNAYSFLFRNG
jgi:1-aminocyclopropane-1-carboxylate deaminase